MPQRELQKRLHGAVLSPIVGALKNRRMETTGDSIGLFFPVHAFSIPLIVGQFLRQVDFKSASYIFAVATRHCSPRLFSGIDKLLRKKRKELNAGFSVQMAENYIPIFETASPEEIRKGESELQTKLDEIHRIITMKQNSYIKKSIYEKNNIPLFWLIVSRVLFPVVTFLYHKTRYFGLEKAFYFDSKCSGCGLCERICLAEKIKMNNNRPEWVKGIDCTFCFACIHYCPEQAIQFNNTKTPARGRYHHPDISAEDIVMQKI